MTESKADGVKVVSPGGTYTGQQGFTYGAGASKETVGAGSICMNVLPMPSGARAKVHYHDRIETIAYMLEGECDVYYGDQLEHKVHLLKGDQIYHPRRRAPRALQRQWRPALHLAGRSFI